MKIFDQTVFLYYSHLDKAAHFYEQIMRFKPFFSLDWVRIYQVAGNASLGIVDEKKGFHRSSQTKPIMLSWTVDDVDEWYKYLREKDVEIVSEPEDNPETGIRAFIFHDPEGYALEVFKWMK
jgi:predicted enzyme related to lactoylglutathione lyase